MKAKAVFESIGILDDKYDFNWAHFSYSIPSVDTGSDFVAEISVRVPKSLIEIEKVKSYALKQSKEYLSKCISVDAYESLID